MTLLIGTALVLVAIGFVTVFKLFRFPLLKTRRSGIAVLIIGSVLAFIGAIPIQGFFGPIDVALNSAGTRIYVTTGIGLAYVSVIDAATNEVLTAVPVAHNPGGLAVDPSGSRVYVASDATGTVSVIDTSSNAVVTIPVGSGVRRVATNPSGTRVYATGSTLSVIDTTTNKVVASIPFGLPWATDVAVHPSGARLYVGLGTAFISLVDTATNAVVDTVRLGNRPQGMALNKLGTRVYVTNTPNSSTVSVLDAVTNAVVATVPVGTFPVDVAVNPSGTRAYVTNHDSGTISVIDTIKNMVVATVKVGAAPQGVTVHPSGTRVYVANAGRGTVSVIDTTTNRVVATIRPCPRLRLTLWMCL